MSTRTTSPPDRTSDREHDPSSTRAPDRTPNRDPRYSAPEPPRLDLSLSQILGGSLAAATAAALGSQLGVVGTITGAAVVSLVASVAGAVYTASLKRTHLRVTSALGTVRSGGERRLGAPARRVLAGAAVVFALAAAGVTLTEVMTGASLNGDPGRTTVSTTLHRSGAGGTVPPPVQRPSPPVTREASPTASPQSSASPTATPSATPSPTATPSLAPPAPTESGDTGTPTPSSTGAPAPSPTVTPTSEPTSVTSPTTPVPVTP